MRKSVTLSMTLALFAALVSGLAGEATAQGGGSIAGVENVPPGKHTLKLWHETLGEVTKEVEVKGGAETRVAVELAKK